MVEVPVIESNSTVGLTPVGLHTNDGKGNSAKTFKNNGEGRKKNQRFHVREGAKDSPYFSLFLNVFYFVVFVEDHLLENIFAKKKCVYTKNII